MHFAIIARDGAGMLEERMKVRDAHLALMREMKRDGRVLDGGALADAAGTMVGSVILCDFADRAALDDYLRREIYLRRGVWRHVDVFEMKRLVAADDAGGTAQDAQPER